MSGGVGFYGKLPGAGDFVKRRLPVDFIEAWDRHFQRAVETGRRELGERWGEAWRNGPAWRFVLPPQVCGSGAWCGLTGPAVDRLGRAFPMVLAAPCTGDVARILGNSDWFDALERVWRQAQHEAASVETFDARVAVLPRPLAEAGDLSALWRGLPWDSGQWRLDMSGAAAAGVMLTEAWRQLCLRPGPWCLWWTGNATRLFATRGLPRSHAVLLDAPPPGEAASVARPGGIADDIVDAFDAFDAIGAAPGLANAAAAESWAPTGPAAPAAVAPATIHEDWLDDDDDATVESVRPAASRARAMFAPVFRVASLACMALLLERVVVYFYRQLRQKSARERLAAKRFRASNRAASERSLASFSCCASACRRVRNACIVAACTATPSCRSAKAAAARAINSSAAASRPALPAASRQQASKASSSAKPAISRASHCTPSESFMVCLCLCLSSKYLD
ncbi:type VI secretion system-associated protein TagF [Burkholderia gladioli]|uniref:type VI secretion system-associated protein TagF n=1 Tax=Burkholderia gladioli TaxID=28095 RepID=UPI001F295967|nr:type VI secretion system-associated protein TagF [Burkholderia gladioli]